jgi:hypothetical protein
LTDLHWNKTVVSARDIDTPATFRAMAPAGKAIFLKAQDGWFFLLTIPSGVPIPPTIGWVEMSGVLLRIQLIRCSPAAPLKS